MAVEQKAKLEQQLWNIANTLRWKMDFNINKTLNLFKGQQNVTLMKSEIL